MSRQSVVGYAVLAFFGGVIVGGLVAHKYTKDKYQEQADISIKEARKAYKEKSKKEVSERITKMEESQRKQAVKNAEADIAKQYLNQTTRYGGKVITKTEEEDEEETVEESRIVEETPSEDEPDDVMYLVTNDMVYTDMLNEYDETKMTYFKRDNTLAVEHGEFLDIVPLDDFREHIASADDPSIMLANDHTKEKWSIDIVDSAYSDFTSEGGS